VDPNAGKVQFCAKTQENRLNQSETSTKQQHSLVCEIQLHLKVCFQFFSQCTQPKAIVFNALARFSLVVLLQALFEILDPQKHNNYQLRRNAFSS
jgi:hypothetical protein